MIRFIVLIVFSAIFTLAAIAQDIITLTTPVTRPSISGYTPGALTIELIPAPRIYVTVVANAGTTSQTSERFIYPCLAPCAFSTEKEVATMIGQMNTANLTTRSLWRRIFDRLILDFPERFPGGAVVK